MKRLISLTGTNLNLLRGEFTNAVKDAYKFLWEILRCNQS